MNSYSKRILQEVTKWIEMDISFLPSPTFPAPQHRLRHRGGPGSGRQRHPSALRAPVLLRRRPGERARRDQGPPGRGHGPGRGTRRTGRLLLPGGVGRGTCAVSGINSFGDFFNFSFINHRSTTLGSTASTRRPGTSSRPRNSPGRADRYVPHSFGYQTIFQPANIFEMKLLIAVS